MNLLIIFVSITISSVIATVDLSNVNLNKYQYFKYPSQSLHSARLVYNNYKPQEQQSIAEYHFKRGKAILQYAGNVLFGNRQQKETIPYIFDPNFGEKWRGEFQRQFGYRGVNLIALLGSGKSKPELAYYGAIGKNFHLKCL